MAERRSIWTRMFGSFMTSGSNADLDVRRVSVASLIAVVSGLLVAFFGGIFANLSLSAGFTSAQLGIAALVVGALTGFLFGIPKIVQNPASSEESQSYRQQVNTNLEQISDWLTKIIVGFGLIQLTVIPGKFESLTGYIALHSDVKPAFSGSVLVYFAATGFFIGYLQTRLYLAAAFGRADRGNLFVQEMRRLREAVETETLGTVDDDTLQQIEDAPAGMVLHSYKNMEAAINEASGKLKISAEGGPVDSAKQLLERKLLEKGDLDLVTRLGKLRELAELAGDSGVPVADATSFVRRARSVASKVRAISDSSEDEPAPEEPEPESN